MSLNKFPGHYTPITVSPAKSTSNLIDMHSQQAEDVSYQNLNNADFPLSSTLAASPNSPFGTSRAKPLVDESVQQSPTRSPTPTYLRHARYFHDDGTLFILVSIRFIR